MKPDSDRNSSEWRRDGCLGVHRADGVDLRRARPGAEVGRRTVSYENIVGLVLSVLTRAVSLRPRCSFPRGSSEYHDGGDSVPRAPDRGAGRCARATRRLHVPGLHLRQALPRRAGDLPADRGRPEVRTDLGRLRPQRAGLLGDQHPVPVHLPAGAGQAAAAPQRSRDADDPGARLEHRGQLRHEHELAGVLG